MAQPHNRTCAVIGGGPAGLMAAEILANANLAVTVYDRMPSVARRLLMAGRGGLNLTHSESLPQFLSRYGAADPRLIGAVKAFPPDRLRAWAAELGQPTYVGTSGRVFPQAMKASPLLRAWLRRLELAGVTFALRHRWIGWREDGALEFVTPDGISSVTVDATVLALGGASWPRLGADGGWTRILSPERIPVVPLRPSNCGVRTEWSDRFRERFEGRPLKTIALLFGGQRVRGEAVITRDGLEGGAVYALSAALRAGIERDGFVAISVDLLPNLKAEDVLRRLNTPRGKQSLSNMLRKTLALPPVSIALAQEAAKGQLGSLEPVALAGFLKAVPVMLTGIAPIDRAISSAGGLAFEAIDDAFMLKAKPGVFAAGEMLDWEAPTGGYLLQACFATGAAAGQGVARYLASTKTAETA